MSIFSFHLIPPLGAIQIDRLHSAYISRRGTLNLISKIDSFKPR